MTYIVRCPRIGVTRYAGTREQAERIADQIRRDVDGIGNPHGHHHRAGCVNAREEFAAIMADMDAAYAAICAAGYPRADDPSFDTPEHKALEAVYVRLRAFNAARDMTAPEQAGVVVPREVVEHLLDWHNERPCGAGQESYDEVIFDVLRASLGEDDEDRCASDPGRDTP
jgi:hypothetical protein